MRVSRMSARGTKPTWPPALPMSASGSNADLRCRHSPCAVAAE
jgi:hypothetical protein